LKNTKLPADFTLDTTLTDAIQKSLREGKLPCAAAFVIARQNDAAPLLVGQTATAMHIHLTRCQLGLFGYPEGKGWRSTTVAERPIPEGLEETIREAAVDGKLSCAQAWTLARQFHIPKMQISPIADQLEIHITPCQLGAF